MNDGARETRIEGFPTPASSSESILDVRETPPPQRHPAIFGAFQRLSPGTSFVLVNDHDPKPLFYQFQAEHTGEFTWEYLEKGPETWRVRIGRSTAPREAQPLSMLR